MKIFYPDEYNLISVVRDKEKMPLLRFIFNAETMEEFEKTLKINYANPDTKLSFTVKEIQQYDNNINNPLLSGTEESIVITLVNDAKPDEKIYIDLFIQDFVTAFILSRALKTPLFTIVSEDDIATLQETKMRIEDLKIVIKTPERRTNDYKNILKAVSTITAEEDETTINHTTVSPNSSMIEKVRAKLATHIYSLYKGSSEAVIETYQYVEKYNQLYKKIGNEPSDETINTLTEEEKELLYMKDLLIGLENDTHPIALAGVSTNDESRALQYIDDAVNFEKIMSTVTWKEVKHLAEKHNQQPLNLETVETATTFFNTDLHSTPEPLAHLIKDITLHHLWSYDWNNPLEDNIDLHTLEHPGDFVGSLMLVIASRMLKLDKVHTMLNLEMGIHPVGILISSLTTMGETFRWAAKLGTHLTFNNKPGFIEEFIKITTLTGGNIFNGAFGMMLHGLAHLMLDEGLTEEQTLMLLNSHPNMKEYAREAYRLRGLVPMEISSLAGEGSCFIMGLLIPAIIESGFQPDEKYVEETLDAIKILGQTVLFSRTDAPVGSEEWLEHSQNLANSFVK